VKAAPEIQARLLDLQALDTKLTQLARRESQLSERQVLEEATARRDAIRADVASTTDALEDLQAELRRAEDDVQVVEARIARDQERMLSTSSAKDALGFEHEIETLRRRRGDLEEIQLVLMERVEEHETALAALTASLEEASAAVTAAEQAVAEAMAEIRSSRDEATRQRAAIAVGIPEELLALYEKQRARYGIGASHLRRGISEASGVALLADEMELVRRAAPDDVIICPQSSAILVRTAESGL